MTNTTLDPRIKRIMGALNNLAAAIDLRLAAHFKQDANSVFDDRVLDFEYPWLNDIFEEKLNPKECLALLVALVPHVQPHFFEQIISRNIPDGGGSFPILGGARGKNFRGFIPTAETVLFLLAGSNFDERLECMKIFDSEHFFAQKQIMWLEEPEAGEPRTASKLIIGEEYIELFILGRPSVPKFSTKFPAQHLETKLDWEDLILSAKTIEQIRELEVWINHGDTLMNDWGMKKKLKPGYRVLFYGPPGTGKTLTASLLGRYTGKKVFKIDLSMIVSKFIGETEKNLSNLFAKAENKDWILFFDEADALFGKRTNVKDAHDKYANQEVSYLLQRVEGYNGLVILASNFRNNIDEAFIRRFQSIIHFPVPKYKERLRLWKKGFPQNITFDSSVNLASIAQKYELSGAEIMNVVQYCCLTALSKGQTDIGQEDLLAGIQKEYHKEGKIMR